MPEISGWWIPGNFQSEIPGGPAKKKDLFLNCSLMHCMAVSLTGLQMFYQQKSLGWKLMLGLVIPARMMSQVALHEKDC